MLFVNSACATVVRFDKPLFSSGLLSLIGGPFDDLDEDPLPLPSDPPPLRAVHLFLMFSLELSG